MSTPLEPSGSYNVDLLMQVREKIVNEPERHFQGSWARAESDPREDGECGTAYCVAGWAAVLDGQELDWQLGDWGGWDADYLADGKGIWSYAQKALGLGAIERAILFAGGNSRQRVLSMLDRLIEAGKNGERIPEGEL